MNQSSDSVTSSSGKIEVIQSLFKEIVKIQKENKSPDENMVRIREIIKESSKVVENSTSSSEMVVDAKILHVGCSYVSSNVSVLQTDLTSFNEATYVRGLLSYKKNSEEVVSAGKEWHCFAPYTYKMFKKSHPLSFMLGTFTFEPPPVKEAAKAERRLSKRNPESEKQVLATVADKEPNAEAESDIYDHILKCLVRSYKKNGRKPVNYFKFISDPTNYWRTVENIFHFAFLVRDGSAKMSIDNGLPVIEPVLKSNEETVNEKPCNNQFCFSLSVRDWEEYIEKFQIQSAGIPPFLNKT